MVYRSAILAMMAAALILIAIHRAPVLHRPFFPRLEDPPLPGNTLEEKLSSNESRLKERPDDLSAVVDHGILMFLMGKSHYAEALNSFNQAWRLGAFDERIFYYSGILYEDLSLFSQAQKQYERFLNHEPDDREVLLRESRLLFRMGKWDDAIGLYSKLVAKNHNDVTSLINLGLAYEKKHELNSGSNAQKKGGIPPHPDTDASFKEAVSCLESAQKIQPNLPQEPALALAKLYFEAGDSDKTIRQCKSLLKSSPGEKEALEMEAVSYEKSGNMEQSLLNYTKLSELEPRDRNVRKKIKTLRIQLKRNSK